MSGGGGNAEGSGTLLQVLLAFFAFGSLNLFLNFFNKWALSPSGGDFHFAFFYSMFHMAMSAIGSWVLGLINPPKAGMPSFAQFKEYKYEMCALALCSSVNIGCNNASLILIGLFVNQIIKATSPLLSMIFSFAVLKRRYSTQLIFIVILIAASAMCAVPFTDPSVTALGIVLVSVATVASSLKPVVGELVMTGTDKPKLEPAALVFYDSCISFFVMMAYWLLVPSERVGSITFLQQNFSLGAMIIAAGSLAAFAYNLSIYYFTIVASAVTVMVATNLLKVCLIATSAVIEGLHDVFNWCGMIVFFLAVFAYAFLSFNEKQKKRAEAAAAAAAAAEEGKAAPDAAPAQPATETTKLVSS